MSGGVANVARCMLAGALLTFVSTAACSRQASTGAATDVEPDARSSSGVPTLGLVEAPGYELVVRHCVTCHGPHQFLQQRGDRETWLGLIRWMQRDHGLMPLLPAVEHGIVDYLATHYGPEQGGRRRALPPELMPPNPYAGGN